MRPGCSQKMAHGKLPATASQSSFSIGVSMDLPTFEVASVKLKNRDTISAGVGR